MPIFERACRHCGTAFTTHLRNKYSCTLRCQMQMEKDRKETPEHRATRMAAMRAKIKNPGNAGKRRKTWKGVSREVEVVLSRVEDEKLKDAEIRAVASDAARRGI